jgi:hypothetical protein
VVKGSEGAESVGKPVVFRRILLRIRPPFSSALNGVIGNNASW